MPLAALEPSSAAAIWRLSRRALPLLVGLVIFFGLYRISNNVAPVPNERRLYPMLLEEASAIEVLSVGSSHSRALNFEVMNLQGFYYWSGGEDIFESLTKVRLTVPKLPNLRCILLPASYGLLLNDNAQSPERHIRRKHFYAEVPTALPLSWRDTRIFVQGMLLPIQRPDHWQGVLLALMGRPPSRRMFGAHGFRAALITPTNAAMVEVAAVARAEYHELIVQGATAATMRRTEDALASIAAVSRRQNVVLVLFTPPYPRVYSEAIQEVTQASLRHTMARFAATHPHVYYYDYSLDPAYIDTWQYFYDDHMSATGATVFSQYFKERLEQEGICH